MSKSVLSLCVNRIEESPTLAITAKAIKLKSEGKDIIGLAAGEPDFDTPDFIKAAAIKAIQDGFTKYTAVSGTQSLKEAIVKKFERDNGLTYKTSEIIVGVGGKQCIFNLCLALLNEGELIINNFVLLLIASDSCSALILKFCSIPDFKTTGLAADI